MGFFKAISSGFSNYTNFSGRARRSEFWWWTLFAILMGLLSIIPILGWLIALAMLLPNLAIQVRRLHDTGHSGWWWFIGIIPIVGAIVLLIFYLSDSKPGPNKWGPNPKGIGNDIYEAAPAAAPVEEPVAEPAPEAPAAEPAPEAPAAEPAPEA